MAARTQVEENMAVRTDPVLAKAVLKAADLLEVTGKELAAILGLSPSSLTRMKQGGLSLSPGTKPHELAVLFVRLFRSLDAVTGGDSRLGSEWMATSNTVLRGRPIDRVQTISGLMDAVAYLDARRARV